MVTIKYGGVEYIQMRNAVHCKLCKDTIQSNHPRDFKVCTCGSVGVDGGIEPGNRIIGNLENIESRCMYAVYSGNKLIWLPQHKSLRFQRNDNGFGVSDTETHRRNHFRAACEAEAAATKSESVV